MHDALQRATLSPRYNKNMPAVKSLTIVVNIIASLKIESFLLNVKNAGQIALQKTRCNVHT